MKRTLLLFLMCVLGMRMNSVSCVLTIDPDYFPGEFSCTLYKTPNLENPNPDNPWYTGVIIPSATFAEGSITSSLPQSFNLNLDYGNYVFAAEDAYGEGFGFTSGLAKLEAPSLVNPLLFQFTNNWGAFETRAFALLPPPPTCTEANTGNTRTTAQVGLASSASTWVGGIVPVDGDKIIINHPIVWDIDCVTDDITIYDMAITISNPFSTITGTLRCKKVTALISGITIPTIIMKGCGPVSFDGTNSLSVDEIIVEAADSLLFNRQTQCAKLKLPVEMVDPFYWTADSLCSIGDTNTPPIIHYPTTHNMIVDGHPKTFEYPFTQVDAGWCIEGSIGISDTLGDYDANNFTSGYTGSDSSTYWQSLYWYDETVIGSPNTMHDGYVDPPFGNATVLAGDAFWGYHVQGVHTRKWSSADILTGNLVKALSFTSPDALPVNMFAGGWNMFSNPFPCTIDGDSLIFSGGGPPVFYTWNTRTRQYNYYSLVSHIGSRAEGQYLAAGQGAWVKTNSTGNTLIIPQTSMVWQQAEYRDASLLTERYTLKISSGDTFYTSTLCRNENAEEVVDEYDAYELNAHNGSVVCPVLVYTQTEDASALALNSLPITDTLYVPVFGKSMTPSNEHILTLETPEATSVTWEIRWENGMEWIPFTEQLVAPDGILSEVEGPIAMLRLIQQQVTDPDTGHPYGWNDVVDNSGKDENSDIVSGITETNKELLIAYCSGHQQITVGSTTKIAAIYNTLGQTIAFEQAGANVRVTTDDIILFIRTTDGTKKRILMH